MDNIASWVSSFVKSVFVCLYELLDIKSKIALKVFTFIIVYVYFLKSVFDRPGKLTLHLLQTCVLHVCVCVNVSFSFI